MFRMSNLLAELQGSSILKLFTDGLNPLTVGLLITSIGVSLSGTTGYPINPARDLGPQIALTLLPIAGKGDSNGGYAWIPVLGPILGGVLGAVVYISLG